MKQSELLDTLTNVQKTNTTNKPLFEREQLPGSPFWLIGNSEQGYNITMGKYKITQEPFKAETIPDALILAYRWLDNNQWDVVLTIALCAITDIENQKSKRKI